MIARTAGVGGLVLGGSIEATQILKRLQPSVTVEQAMTAQQDLQNAKENLEALRDEQALHHNVHAEEIAAAEKQVAEAQKVYDSMLQATQSYGSRIRMRPCQRVK
jgi:hypothetical protein